MSLFLCFQIGIRNCYGRCVCPRTRTRMAAIRQPPRTRTSNAGSCHPRWPHCKGVQMLHPIHNSRSRARTRMCMRTAPKNFSTWTTKIHSGMPTACRACASWLSRRRQPSASKTWAGLMPRTIRRSQVAGSLPIPSASCAISR